MNTETINTQLYEKMFAEQERYRGWLLSQPPKEILNHTYEYTTREDILMTLENNDLRLDQAQALFAAGADVITLGNHTWGKMQITDYLEDNRYILRPANFSPRTPGRGYGVYDLGRVQVAVLCLIGRCDLAWGSDNPFTTADRLLKAGEKPTFTLVDFHAQATSEKLAMAYYLDGRVSALWGTHTHVPTADERVFPKGTGYITDLGMTGAVESVLGIRPEHIMLAGEGEQMIHGTVDVSEMMGSAVHLHLQACGRDTIIIVQTMSMQGATNSSFGIGQSIAFTFGGNVVHVFDPETGKNLEF